MFWYFLRRQASLYFVLLRPNNCRVEKLTATLNKFNKCYEWNVRENFLFNSDSSSSVPSLSLRNVVSSPFTFFLRLLQPKAQHCVPNFPIFLTAYNNYVAKVITPIWRRLNFVGFIFCLSRHMSCSIQSYFSDQWLVRNLSERGRPGKLRSYWENEIHEVVEQNGEMPVFVVKPEGHAMDKVSPTL